MLVLEEDGSIRHMSSAARSLLEHAPEAPLPRFFFSHVHARSQSRVMRDVADMVRRGLKQTTWLLRLRTGRARWRWFKASVDNRLDAAEGALLVFLIAL